MGLQANSKDPSAANDTCSYALAKSVVWDTFEDKRPIPRTLGKLPRIQPRSVPRAPRCAVQWRNRPREKGHSMTPDEREGIIEDLTLMLLYLTSWEEGRKDFRVRRAWKSYDWDAIDALCDEGLIGTSHRAKSATLSDEACVQAALLVDLYASARGRVLANLEVLKEVREKHKDAFRLRIDLDLDGLQPCWREIIVPGWFTFGGLHEAIQASFLWWDYHMHDFKLRSHGEDLMLVNPEQGGVDGMFAPPAGKRRVVDDVTVLLGDVFPRTRTVAYSYDYGDGWEMTIRLIETIKGEDATAPVCVGGEGDAPPEDVGSPSGFKHFLEAIGDENHPDHDSMKAWGYGQFFEPFSIDAVNRRIEKWATGELLDEWDERHSA